MKYNVVHLLNGTAYSKVFVPLCVCACVYTHMQAVINIIQITYNNHQYVLLWGSLKLQFYVCILNRKSTTL